MTVTEYASAAVDSALSWAEKQASELWDDLGDAVEKTLTPGKYRFKERNSKYKTAMNSLLNSAQAAAKAGDYVTATALARTAQFLSTREPYRSWPQIDGAESSLVAQAAQLAAAYEAKAGVQMSKGLGGTFRPTNAAPLLIAAGLGALLLLRGRK